MRIYGLFSNREYNLSAVDPAVTKWLAWWMLAFVTLSLNRDGNQGWQTTERNDERLRGEGRERERETSATSRMYRTTNYKQKGSERSKQQVKRRDGYRETEEKDGGRRRGERWHGWGGKWREGCTVTSYLVCNSRSIHLRVLAPLFTRASRFLTTIARWMESIGCIYLFSLLLAPDSQSGIKRFGQ